MDLHTGKETRLIMNTEKKNNLLLNSLSTPLNELVFSIIQTDVNPD